MSSLLSFYHTRHTGTYTGTYIHTDTQTHRYIHKHTHIDKHRHTKIHKDTQTQTHTRRRKERDITCQQSPVVGPPQLTLPSCCRMLPRVPSALVSTALPGQEQSEGAGEPDRLSSLGCGLIMSYNIIYLYLPFHNNFVRSMVFILSRNLF